MPSIAAFPNSDKTPRFGRVAVYLKDGRVFDLTGLEPKAAIEYLQARGVRRPSEIRRTVHRISISTPSAAGERER
jgi:hypothetical protein